MPPYTAKIKVETKITWFLILALDARSRILVQGLYQQQDATMEQSNGKLTDFVAFKRDLLASLRKGEITKDEFFAYTYIRLSGNPYGYTVTSFENIRNDIFRGKSINYCNQLLLSLKSKRFIYYADRRGRRGSFEIHLGDWILPNKKIKTLDRYFNEGEVRGSSETQTGSSSEPAQSIEAAGKNLDEQKRQVLKPFSALSDSSEVRGSYNDTNKENNTYVKREEISFKGGRLRTVTSFVPDNSDEQ